MVSIVGSFVWPSRRLSRSFFASRRRVRLIAGGMTATMIAAGMLVAVSTPAQAVTLSPIQVGPRPSATRVPFTLGERVKASVDVGTGNLLVTTTDLTLPGVAKDLQVGLDFNSLSLGSGSPDPQGAAGTGFNMRIGQDTTLVENSDASVLYFAPEGRQGLFTSNGAGGYLAPAGFKDKLVKNGSTGWILTNLQSNEVSAFDAGGQLTSVTDRNGQATTFTYSGGKLTTITSTRGGTNSRKVTVSMAYSRTPAAPAR